MKEDLIELYLDFVNNFITIEKACEWYGLEPEDYEVLIKIGKKYHEQKL